MPYMTDMLGTSESNEFLTMLFPEIQRDVVSSCDGNPEAKMKVESRLDTLKKMVKGVGFFPDSLLLWEKGDPVELLDAIKDNLAADDFSYEVSGKIPKRVGTSQVVGLSNGFRLKIYEDPNHSNAPERLRLERIVKTK